MSEVSSTYQARVYVGRLHGSEANAVITREGFGWIEDSRTVRDVEDMFSKGFGVSLDAFLGTWGALVRPGPIRDICRTFFDTPVLTAIFVRNARQELQRPAALFLESCKDKTEYPAALGVQLWSKGAVICLRREQAGSATDDSESGPPSLAMQPTSLYLPEGGVSFTWLPGRLTHPDTTAVVAIECINGLGLYGSLIAHRDVASCKSSPVRAEGEELRRLKDVIYSFEEQGLRTIIEASDSSEMIA